MKKFIVIAGLIGIAVLALGAFSQAFAQTEPPPPSTSPGYGNGMMGGRRGYGGMSGPWLSDKGGTYHELMVATFAEELGLAVDTMESRLESGESLWQIAEAEGFTAEEFADMMRLARQARLDQAVDDGSLTQEQADALGSKWQSRGFGRGYGDCPGYASQGGFHQGQHGRWNNP